VKFIFGTLTGIVLGVLVTIGTIGGFITGLIVGGKLFGETDDEETPSDESPIEYGRMQTQEMPIS
jgi:purine-cytosine permease-like protein